MVSDKLLQNERITPELLDYVVQKIAQAIEPEKIILYGSYQRGDFQDRNDVDLMIIKESTESNRTLRKKVDKLLQGRRFPINIRIRKPSEVQENLGADDPFYAHDVFGEGKVLYERQPAKK